MSSGSRSLRRPRCRPRCRSDDRIVILLSRLKYEIIVWMTANFLDVWIINRRHRQLFALGETRSPLQDRRHGRARARGHGTALVDRQLPGAAADRKHWICLVPRRPDRRVVRVPAGRLGSLVRRPLCVQVLALGRIRDPRIDDPGIHGVRRDRHRSPEDAAGGDLLAGPQAAAHPTGARRVRASTFASRPASRSRRTMAITSVPSTAGTAVSSPRAPAVRAGTPSTTCSRACPRARSDALPTT